MDPVVVLDATMTLAAARAALDLASDQVRLVVRRVDPRATGLILWYPLDAEAQQRVLRADLDPDLPLGVSLDLHEHGATEVRPLGHPDVIGETWTGLVVDGTRAVGWVSANPDRGPVRSIDFGPDSGQLQPVVPVEGAGPVGEEPPALDPDTFGDQVGPLDAPPPATVPVYPRVDVPEAVPPGAAFEVVVGLARTAQPGVQGAALALPAQTQELIVQIKAENFTVSTVRHTLAFDPANVAANTVAIPLTAPVVQRPWRGRVEIEYSLNGLLIGTAWREVLCTPNAPADAPPSTSGGEVAVQLDQRVPIDLTVSISRGQADGTFLWTFTTPHPVPLPTQQVITNLDRDTAATFALRKVREMADVDGSPAAELRVKGVASEVASVMPLDFWRVLAPVWTIVKAQSRLPTLLLVSQESLVPWELASTDPDYIVDRTLVDPALPQLLGTQLIVGRWRPAGPETPSGMRRPSTTPAESMTVTSLAVVVGEYGAKSRLPALPEAIAEGQELTASYPSVWVKGTAAEVSSLLNGQFTDRGAPIDAQVLHVASHGEADPDAPKSAGVVLSDSAIRIDEIMVAGSDFTRTAAPLVFLNACQLGSQTGGALVEGGLAAAFLQAGARAFIAPLWKVDDTLAKQTALAFYAGTLGAGRPAGEVMRQLRARFSTDFPQRDQTTPLAYAYYGHPGLTLTTQEA